MRKKTEGELARIGAVAGWGLVAFLWIQWGLWYVFAAYFALHLTEALTIGMKRGTAAGYSHADSLIFTFVFGFTWWSYLEC